MPWRHCTISPCVRFGLPAVLAILTVAILVAECAPAADRPNVLLIMVDDLGYGDLSSYGATDLQTPRIDQLIAHGMRWDNFYANCPVCSPTRASLLTGRYPELVGVPGVIRTHPENSWGYLDPKAVTLPQLFAQAGYETAMVGKWHLGLTAPNRPNERGFGFFHGFLGDMMDDYYHHRRHETNYMRKNENTIDPQGHATDLFSQWAVDYLRMRRTSQPPFFLYLAYNAPHTPIQPPADWLAKVKSRAPEMSDRRARLVALIEHLDHGIGQVLQALDASGLSKQTVVVFTSDNGGQVSVAANNGPLRDGKQSMYEGGLKVAASVTWPDHIAAGSRTAQNGITMDLFPTLCELAEVPISQDIDGVSLANILLGKQRSVPPRDLFFHRREGGERYGGLTTQAIRRGPWKLLQNSPFAPLELYNLTDDPLEKTNLANANRQIFRELSQALRLQIQRGGAIPWQATGKNKGPARPTIEQRR